MTEGTKTIEVVVADDHPVVRSGLRRVLEEQEDLDVVAEAGDLQEALRKVSAYKPDVLLLDLVMPGGPSVEAIPSVHTKSKDTRVVILTMLSDVADVRAALRAGANGFVLKEAPTGTVLEAVREVASGRTYVDPAVGARLAREPESEGPPDGLSHREAEVLGLVALGLTNQEIADKLFISVRTVEAHRTHIQNKMDFGSRAELVRYALDHGLTEA
jgi:two-component system response regulator NreC